MRAREPARQNRNIGKCCNTYRYVRSQQERLAPVTNLYVLT